MNNKDKLDLQQYLQQQPELKSPPAFDLIMEQLQQRQKSHRLKQFALTACVIFGILLILTQVQQPTWQSPDTTLQIEQLTVKVELLEQVVRTQIIQHSEPGSPIIDKIVSMENWLDHLSEDIESSDNPNRKIELLHAKLEILSDLMTLHQAYNS